MRIAAIDHLYAETLDWEESVAFWERLGFEFVDRWGDEGHRAGRLECNDAALVLAEISEGDPAFNVFFELQDPESGTTDLPGVVTPLSDTHWGTRWIRLADPEGRIHVLEVAP